jgi:hypothetical protein
MRLEASWVGLGLVGEQLVGRAESETRSDLPPDGVAQRSMAAMLLLLLAAAEALLVVVLVRT